MKLEYDPEADCYVTSIPELHGISTYGQTIEEALNETRDLIIGFLDSAEAHKQRIPLTKRQVEEVRSALAA